MIRSDSLLQIQLWPVSRLLPYAGNARRNDHAVGRMVAAIQQFGFKVPLLIRSQGEIVDGHLRLKAARQLGLEEVPVILIDDLTEAQVRAFRLLVNRSVDWAHWDEGLVALELQQLATLDFDLSLTGFDAPEIDAFLAQAEDDAELDVILEPPLQPVSVAGDLWCCADHRILCGDATVAGDVARLLGPGKPHLMVTDPPFGVCYEPEWREQAGLGRPRQTGKVTNDDRVDWSEAYRLFSGDVAYVWHAGVHAAEVAANLAGAGFQIRSQIVWGKQHFALSRGHYHWQHEPCWYAVRTGQPSRWRGDRTQSTLWQLANLNPFGGSTAETPTGHSTQKPIELMRRPIVNHTERGEWVYDAFLGSGSTLIAAELSQRRCCGMEINPGYVDLAVRRWQQRTGRAALLESGRHTFEQVRAERAPVPCGQQRMDREQAAAAGLEGFHG